MDAPLLVGQRVRLVSTPHAGSEYFVGHTGTITYAQPDGDIGVIRFGSDGGVEVGVNRGMVELVEGAPNPVPSPLPSVGRIVHYKLEPSGEIVPGIVTFVNSDAHVWLTLFHPASNPTLVGAARFGDTPGTWHWPPRV